MIGDKLIFLENHREKAKKIIEKFNFDRNKKSVIVIDGESGTGKSEIAYLLRNFLLKRRNVRSIIFCLDDYKTNQKAFGIDQIYFSELESTIDRFFNDIPNIRVKIYDKFTDCLCSLYYNSKDVDTFIIEGTFSLNINKAKYKVLLKESYKETEDFRIKRNRNSEYNTHLEKEHEELEKLKNKIKPGLIL